MSTSIRSEPCGCTDACAYGIGLPNHVFCKEQATAEDVGHPPILWLDMETTGLDPTFDQVLEVCFIVTGADLEPRGAYASVVMQPELVTMKPVVWEMHNKSGLLDEVHSMSAKVMPLIEMEVLSFLLKNGVSDKSPLAGSTIHFDRSFLRRDLPLVNGAIHYRNIDVSSLRELVKRWVPDELYTKGDIHRAGPDCVDSIRQLKHYRKVFGL